MKLRDLRPCDWCGKQLAGRMPDGRFSIQFYVITLATAILNTQAINEHVGLMHMLGGSGRLAEIFTSHSEVAAIVEDQPGAGGRDEAFLCFDCYTSDIMPAALAERVQTRKAKALEVAPAAAGAKEAAREREPEPAGGHAPAVEVQGGARADVIPEIDRAPRRNRRGKPVPEPEVTE